MINCCPSRRLSQLASALAYLHDKRIIHTDIKPANILLANNFLKLCSFESAIVGLNEDEMNSASTRTLQYCAPELLAEHPRYSFKSDIFCLGCVVYEMSALKPAFSGTIGQIIEEIRMNRPITLVSSAFSHDLQSLIQEMMSSSPQDRPSAADILRRPLVKLNLPKLCQVQQN